jgi:DNA replication ATP-dependent helicase Dna2
VQFIETNRKSFEKILHVHDKKSQASAKCCLKGLWYETDVAVNDTISVRGLWNEERKIYMLTNDTGMIVVLPDHLISGTTVVGSLFCARKSVLTERFRGIDAGDSIIVSSFHSFHFTFNQVNPLLLFLK